MHERLLSRTGSSLFGDECEETRAAASEASQQKRKIFSELRAEYSHRHKVSGFNHDV